MRIIPRKSKRGDQMFIFEFETKESEFDPTINTLKYFAEEIPMEESKQAFLNVISTLEKRCDSHYANEEYEVSTMLFENEMASFCLRLIVALWCTEDTIRDKHELDDYVDSLTMNDGHNDDNTVHADV